MITANPQHTIRWIVCGTRLGLATLLSLAMGLPLASIVARAQALEQSIVTVQVPPEGPVPAVVTNFRCHIMPAAPPPGQPAGAPVLPDCDKRPAQPPPGPSSTPSCNGGCGVLNYNGGPVVTSSLHRFIFLNCPGGVSQCFSDWGNPLGFLTDYFDSNFIHVTDQYMEGLFVPTASNKYATTGAGAQVTVSAPHVMSDSDVHNYIMTAINQVFNPSGGGGGYNQMYSLFLPPGQDLCMGSPASCYCPDNSTSCTSTSGIGLDFCAYHSSFDAVDITGTTIHVIYQAMPYANVADTSTGYYCHLTNGPNGALIDSTNNIFSHEITETITDPDPNSGWTRNSDGQEIGDICQWIAIQNPIYLHGNAYETQMEYSNKAKNCVGAYKTVALTHDFNFDMNSDIAWHDTSGDVAAWLMDGTSVQNPNTAGIGTVATTWSIVGIGDFNGDGKSDILLRDTSGNVAIWEMNGTTVLNPNTAGVGNVPTTWTIVGTGDFNGDGKSDILWRDTSGNVAIWEMNGTTVLNPNAAGVGNVPVTWSIVGTGDFSGDGKTDILWRDTSGNVAIWEMNGTTVLNPNTAGIGNVGTTWTIVGTGDFNGDGYEDILWHDTSGNVAIWEMTGTQVLNPNTAGVGNVSISFKIVGSGDFNGDAKSDILWRDTSGNVAIWEMNGTQILNPNTAGVGNVSTVWTIQDALGQ
jgi:hypothetical protein